MRGARLWFGCLEVGRETEMEAIFILLVIFSVPLAGIVSGTYLKAKKLQAESGGGSDMAQRVKLLEDENARVNKRLETLETIVTSERWDHLARPDEYGVKAEEAAEQLAEELS